ncbi:hypothetical protein Vadar_033919 [Vaccinium darrowii]|uniref:Uncharacterized protein n=1 Tax=Vaccinium darrowii TaxID=229202 RepID=A0ACB7YI28_9ERIC|nr:hypothetical protein Vadar_033919 [Vaccinium darrowii]
MISSKRLDIDLAQFIENYCSALFVGLDLRLAVLFFAVFASLFCDSYLCMANPVVLLCKQGESNCGAVLSQSLTFKCLIDKLLGKWNDLIEGFVFIVLFVAWSSMLFLDTEEDLNVLHALAVSSQISCVNVIVRDLVGSVSGSTVVNASSNGNDDVRLTPSKRPYEFVQVMKWEYGVDVSYRKVWMGVEKARGYVFGDYTSSFKDLAWYVDAAKAANLTSVFDLEYDENRRFTRLFVGYDACNKEREEEMNGLEEMFVKRLRISGDEEEHKYYYLDALNSLPDELPLLIFSKITDPKTLLICSHLQTNFIHFVKFPIAFNPIPNPSNPFHYNSNS